MLSRYVDGLQKAKSKALEMMKQPLSEHPKIFIEFIDGVKVAAGSAHQMAHTQVDHSTRWLALRDNLEKVIEIGQILPSFNQQNNGLWLKISKSLDIAIDTGKRLAASKAMSRADILFELDQRKTELEAKLNTELNDAAIPSS